MAKENIYIDLNEDIQSVIGKIQETDSEEIDLVVPTGARVLQNIVDAHLIQEAGVASGKILSVITSDLMGRIFAERAGLSVASQNGPEDGEIMASQTVSTGRMSDILPKRGGIAPRTVSGAKASAAVKFSAKDAHSKHGGSLKKAMMFSNSSKNSKGEVGASFLKSYREERAKPGVFSELGRINRKRNFSPFKINISTFVWSVAGFAIIIALVVFMRVLPKADLNVYPVRENVSENIEVFISSKDSKIDFNKGIIPGELLTLEKTESGEFSATGMKEVSQKAKGKIIIYNAYASQTQALVPSRFQTEDGKIFWTTKSVVVPGFTLKDSKTTPGQIEAEVVAGEAGEAYNIGPAKFSMPALKNTPKAGKIYAVSSAPMSGGKTGKSSIVSADDVNNAYKTLRDKLQPQIQSLKQNLPAGFQLWPEAYNEELAESSAAPEAGEAGDKFNATVKMIARAIVFRSQDLDSYISKEMVKNIEDKKTPLPSSKEISFIKPPVIDYQKGAISASLMVKHDNIDSFDADSFRNAILNKNESDIKKVISTYKNIERIEVKFWPFWVRSVPSNTDRVKVSIVGL